MQDYPASYTFRLSAEQHAYIERHGGAAYIRELIAADMREDTAPTFNKRLLQSARASPKPPAVLPEITSEPFDE